MTDFPGLAALRFLLICAVLGGCSAVGDGWPRLAGEPRAEPVTLLPRVDMPPPTPLTDPMNPEAATAWYAALPGRVAALGERQERLVADYRATRKTKANDRLVAGSARRAAEMGLSRLGALLSDIERLLRQADAAGPAPDPTGLEALDGLLGLDAALTALLDQERRILAES